MSTTTTTTTKPEASKKIDLFSFLDTRTLTRAERSYYTKHNKSYADQEKTIAEWEKVIKFIH